MRKFGYVLLISSMLAGSAAAGTISLTGSTDIVAFNGNLDFLTVTMGSASCPTFGTGTCTYGGSQPLGTGTLTWNFQTPNTGYNITYDPFGNLTGPTGGTFTASDGIDSFQGSYVLSTWNYDGNSYGSDSQFEGIDLNGTISIVGISASVTGINITTCVDSNPSCPSPNQAAFAALFQLPGTTAYSFTLDVGNCTAGGRKTVACIQPTDPSATFTALNLTPLTSTPEPGTIGMMAGGLLAMLGVRLRARKSRSAQSN